MNHDGLIFQQYFVQQYSASLLHTQTTVVQTPLVRFPNPSRCESTASWKEKVAGLLGARESSRTARLLMALDPQIQKLLYNDLWHYG